MSNNIKAQFGQDNLSVKTPLRLAISRRLSHPSILWISTGMGFVLLGIVLWLPFGFRMTGLVEEWTIFRNFDTGTLVPQGFPLNRAGQYINFWIGYFLTPDSFVGLVIFHAFLFLGKGILLYAILKRLLPESASLSFVTAIVFVIYPADVGLFYLRLTPYHSITFFYLLAVYLFVRFWERPRIIMVVGMGISLIACMGTYEVAYPTIMITPLLLIWLNRRLDKQVLRVALLWYIIPLLFLAFTLILYLNNQLGYQTALIEQGLGNQGFTVSIRSILSSLARAYHRFFIQGWYETLNMIDESPIFLLLALIAGLAAGIITFIHDWTAQQRKKFKIAHLILFFTVGIVLASLGFAPFLPSPFHRVINDRVFIFASFGATLSFCSVVYFVSQLLPARLNTAFFAACASAIVGLATLWALHQHKSAFQFALYERDILSQITAQAPDLDDEYLVLLLYNETQFLLSSEMLFGATSTSVHFRDAISYLYDQSNLVVMLCFPTMNWRVNERCELNENHVALYVNDQLIAASTYDRVIVFRYDYRVELLEDISDYVSANVQNPVMYSPYDLIKEEEESIRLKTVFQQWPLQLLNSDRNDLQSTVVIEFNQLLPGRGWSSPEQWATWTASPEATLNLSLVPADYDIEFRIVSSLLPEILASLTLHVNDQPIALTSQLDSEGATLFLGSITEDNIRLSGDNTHLRFNTSDVVSPQAIGLSPDTRELGVMFDWLRIVPHQDRDDP